MHHFDRVPQTDSSTVDRLNRSSRTPPISGSARLHAQTYEVTLFRRRRLAALPSHVLIKSARRVASTCRTAPPPIASRSATLRFVSCWSFHKSRDDGVSHRVHAATRFPSARALCRPGKGAPRRLFRDACAARDLEMFAAPHHWRKKPPMSHSLYGGVPSAKNLVETRRFELLTSCLQSRRSTN